MSECSLISQPLIPLSASGVASKLLYAGHTLGINSDNLQASCYTNLQFCQMMYISLIVFLIKSSGTYRGLCRKVGVMEFGLKGRFAE